MDTSWILPILFIPLALTLVLFYERLTQSATEFKDEIEADLHAKGFELVDIVMPKVLQKGPFPTFQFSVIRKKILGVSGDRTRYRIVRYKNSIGLLNKSWVRIDIVSSGASKIKWMPEL